MTQSKKASNRNQITPLDDQSIRKLEAEAQKQGISPQAFLENYLHENLTPVR